MRLLQPLHIGGRTAPSRVVFGPHETNLGDGRALSERHVAYYARRAAGGAGMVVIETASVHESDWPYERAPLASRCGRGWQEVVRACGAHGCLVVASLGHAGGQGSSAYSQAPLWAPSPVPEVSTREVPKVMEKADIAAVVAGFAAAARIAGLSGVDGVEVNAGQHSLVRQFLSPLTNMRGDAWGADRDRLLREVLAAVRAGVGAAIVGLRLCVDELAPWGGLTPDDAVAIAARCAQLVDYVVVVRGSIYSVEATRPDCHVESGMNIGAARRLRAALPASACVVAQGSIVDAEMAERIVADGVADAVEMTRAQIADASLVTTLRSGASDRVRPCILCNQACQVRDGRNPVVTCVGDPASGHEATDLPYEDRGSAGRTGVPVLVVGGGPAGLECARVAALRGHAVRLVERSPRCGGMVAVAAGAPGRERLGLLVAWLERECRRLGVEVGTGEEADAGEVRGFAGAVVICTGSRAGRRDYAVDTAGTVLDAADVLRDGGPSSGTVLVWDPVGGPAGISIVEMLAAGGCTPVLATPDHIAGSRLSRTGDMVPANGRLHRLGVRIEKRVLLRRVGAGVAEIEDRFSARRRELSIDAVVDAGHRLPDDALWRSCRDVAVRAGDAVAPRSIHEAVLEGRRAALAVGVAA